MPAPTACTLRLASLVEHRLDVLDRERGELDLAEVFDDQFRTPKVYLQKNRRRRQRLLTSWTCAPEGAR